MDEQSKLSADGLEVVAWSVVARYPHRETVKALFFTEAEADNQGAEWCYDDAVVTVSPLIGAGKYSDAQRLLSQLREELAHAEQWRDLAMQFDRHRMNAMALIKAVAAGKAGSAECEVFASVPPIPGHEITAEVDQLRARIAALESQQAASLDAAAERNAMQRQRDDAKKLLVRECDDADELVRLLGLDPEAVRTDGGFLNLAAVRSMLAASVGGERDAFEAAFSDTFFSACFEQEADGTYAGRGLQGAWMGWQKRAALSPAGGGVAELPEELFDGMAVYQALERRDRTSPENVSDTLNVLAKLIRARLNAKPSYAPELLADIQERCLAGMGGPALQAFSALSTIHALIEKAKPQANSQGAE